METADVITLASTAGFVIIALGVLGALRHALRMSERQIHRADAARVQWERAHGAVGAWRARALEAEQALLVGPPRHVPNEFTVQTTTSEADATRTMEIVEGVQRYDGHGVSGR